MEFYAAEKAAAAGVSTFVGTTGAEGIPGVQKDKEGCLQTTRGVRCVTVIDGYTSDGDAAIRTCANAGAGGTGNGGLLSAAKSADTRVERVVKPVAA